MKVFKGKEPAVRDEPKQQPATPPAATLTIKTTMSAKVEGAGFTLEPTSYKDGFVTIHYHSGSYSYHGDWLTIPNASIPELVKLLQEVARVTLSPDAVVTRTLE